MEQVVHDYFALFDDENNGELTPEQLMAIYETMRLGGLSLPQVKASMDYVCVNGNVCEEWELIDLLKEMDRRYFLVQDLKWEFSLLDINMSDTITEKQAMWLVQAVHGKVFSHKKWSKFVKDRVMPGSRVSFPEIEVELCNIPSYLDIVEELELEKERNKEALIQKQLEEEERNRKKEAEKKFKEEQKKKLEDLEKKKAEQKAKAEQEKKKAEMEEQVRAEEEEKVRKDAEEQKRREEEREQRRLEREDEERKRKAEEERLEKLKKQAEEKQKRDEEEAKNIEELAKHAAAEEAAAEKAAKEAAENIKRAQDARSKKELEEIEAEARKKQQEMKEKKIRANLKVAIKIRQKAPLKSGISDFKKANLLDHDNDVPTAEKILKFVDAKEKLQNAMNSRQIKELEEAMNNVRKQSFESDLQPEMIEANNLLLRLRRLERIRAEILELKQSTVAEIRSYSSPPPVVHSVMIGTFLILGHPESETKEWKKVQALVGKTGKDGLKRRCLEYDPQSLAKKLEIAVKAKNKMSDFELDDVRDVSAGAATFYLWASNMIEEAEMIAAQAK